MLTKLEAVNAMLMSIHESPVSSLDAPITEEVALAVKTLDRLSEDVQRDGYTFNTETNFTLMRDANNNITLPANACRIKVDPVGLGANVDITVRGRRLYDRYNHTYEFTTDVKCAKMIRILDWADLPDVFRRYVSLRAARIFTALMTGSQQTTMAASIEEAAAFRTFKRDYQETQRPNLLRGPGMTEISYRNTTWLSPS
jgi:hypothetical protein